MAVKTTHTFNAVGSGGQGTTSFTNFGIQLNNENDLDVYVTLSGGTRVLQYLQSTASTADSNHPQVNDTTGLYFPAVSSGASLTNYTISADLNTITFNAALASGAVVTVERRTRDASSSYTTFAGGSTIRSTELNNAFDEANFTAQDARNKAFDLERKLFDGASSTSIKTKLDGIEANATADQTNTEIRTAVGAASDSNIFTDALKSKLDAIEAGATVDQSNTDIRTAVEAASDSNVFTDADHSKLNAIEASATADQTDAEIRAAVEAASDSNVFTDADHSKLNAIEASATADQTGAQIKSAYEAESNTNAYIDTHNALVGGITSTASELNILDGVTADKDELNLLDGKSIVTTISGSATDAQIPTAQAVDERITTVVTDVGGFVPIANETSFPSTNPDVNDGTGTIVSVKALASNLTSNGSGVATIANGAGSGNTVTITGMSNSTTYAAGKGLILETTSTLHTYTFHRLVLDETGVSTASTLISDFNERYRIGGSNPTGSLDNGDLFFNTGTGKMLVYNTNNTAWEEVQSVGNFYINTISSYSGTGGNSATFDGTAWRFVLSNAPTYAQQLIVSVNGVIQKPNSGTSKPSEGFAIDGSSILFGDAPASGSNYFIITIGSTVNIGAPSDNTVGNASIIDGAIDNAAVNTNAAIAGSKLAAASITSTQLANDAVTQAKIAADSISTNHIIAGTITTADIADSLITTVKINADAVTGAKIADNAIDSEHYTDGSIDTAHIGNNQVTTAKIAADAIDGTKLADDAVNSEHYTDGSIDTAHIAADQITSALIADDQIDSEHYVDGSIDLAHMSSESVDEDNLYISNAGSNGQFLSKQSGNNGGLTWASVTSTPEGTAILSTGESGGAKYLREDGDGTCSWQSVPAGVGGASGVDFNDTVKARFGTDNDIQIHHTSGSNYIEGALRIGKNDNVRITDAADNTQMGINATSAYLNYEGNQKLITTNTGVTVTGQFESMGYESPATVANNWSIGANNNAMFPGPMTVASGVTVTVPANRTLTVV